jgi:hypothetical protein
MVLSKHLRRKIQQHQAEQLCISIHSQVVLQVVLPCDIFTKAKGGGEAATMRTCGKTVVARSARGKKVPVREQTHQRKDV